MNPPRKPWESLSINCRNSSGVTKIGSDGPGIGTRYSINTAGIYLLKVNNILCSSVSVFNFEHVITDWEGLFFSL